MAFFDLHEPECPGTELTDDERVVAGILFWARNKKIVGGLEERIQKGFLVGPSGMKSKGFWHPTGMEACDRYLPNFTAWTELSKKVKSRPNPWAVWKHCRTLGHCTYLVKHRASYVLGKLDHEGTLVRMVKGFMRRELP